MGDQFIALSAGRTQPPDEARHFGLVVDDKEAVRSALQREGVDVQPSGSCDFIDPWGNHVQVVDYRDQFTKAPGVAAAMGIAGLEKTDVAREELPRPQGLGDKGRPVPVHAPSSARLTSASACAFCARGTLRIRHARSPAAPPSPRRAAAASPGA